jgi:hypothetical protein
MADIKIPYLTSKRVAGRALFYWQPKPAMVAHGCPPPCRLPDDPLRAAEAARALYARWKAEQPGGLHQVADSIRRDAAATLEAVARDYLASSHFSDRRENTRRGYRQLIGRLLPLLGDQPVRSITRPVIEHLYERLRPQAHSYANATMRILRILLVHAKRRGLIETMPTDDFRLIGTRPRGIWWQVDELDQMAAAASGMGWPSLALAMRLAGYLCQRQGDVLALTRDNWRDSLLMAGDPPLAGPGLDFQQSKTGVRIRAVLPDPLIAHLLPTIAARPAGSPIVCCEMTGRAWNADTFRHCFARVRDEVARTCPDVERLQFEDLRRSGMVWLKHLGLDITAIAAMSGHQIERAVTILNTYLPATDEDRARAIHAVNAAHRLTKSEKPQEARQNRAGTKVGNPTRKSEQ